MSKRIAIVGGGVVGLSSAYYAARKGHDVTIIERGNPDHDSCSLGNAGMIVPSHFVPLAAPGMISLGLRMMFNRESPFTVRPRLSRDLIRWGWQFWRSCTKSHVSRSAPVLRDLNLKSRRNFLELAETIGQDFGLTTRGLMMLCKTEHMLFEESKTAEYARELGIPAEVLTPDAASKLNPGLQLDIAGAVYFPEDAHLTPEWFIPRLTKAIDQMGVKFEWSTDVLGWRTQNRRVEAMLTSQGEVVADEYVIAAGSWSNSLTSGLKLRLSMQAGKGYSVTMPRPQQKPAMGCILTEARVAITPMGTGLRVGGTMEVTGLDTSINHRRVQGIFKSVPQYFPAFKVEDFQTLPIWCGLRPCSPDGLPYIGRAANYDNFSVATGHAMMGLSLGPITGQLMAEVLSDESPSLDLNPLRPDRYA